MNPLLKRLSISPVAAYTLQYHLPAMVFIGVMNAVLGMSDIVMRKTLLASPQQIMVLTIIQSFSMVISLYWGEHMRGKPKRYYFLTVGMLSRVSLVLMMFVHNANQFMLVVSIFYCATSVMYPAMNAIWQFNYNDRQRGRFYGLGVTISTIVLMAVSYTCGHLLDKDASLYHWMYFVAGIAGVIEICFWSTLKIFGESRLVANKTVEQRSFIQVVKESFKILRDNPQFMRFEWSFMLYGFAFMSLVPVIPIFLVDKNYLHLSYSVATTAKVTIASFGMLLSPLFGLFMDKVSPMKFTFWACACLALFPLIIMGAVHYQVLVYVAFGFWSVGMAMINLAWNLSSIYFAGKEDASPLQGAHAGLVGIRGVLGPMMGTMLMTYVNINFVFYIASGLFASAAVGMYFHEKDRKRLAKIKLMEELE